MKKEYTPYNFNEKNEYDIYSQIGVRYRKESNGKKRMKESVSFDKFTEWEKYFKDKFLKNDSNDYNFLHYLKGMLSMYQKIEDSFKALVIPSYMTLITIMLTIYSTVGLPIEVLIFTMTFGIILVIVICTFFFNKYRNKINFYEDCINIIKNDHASHQN